MSNTYNRRHILRSAGLIGCSVAASPLLTPVSFAAGPWDTRLIVIILRGGMDGLDVVQPYGAPELAALRPGFGFGPPAGAIDLDGFFAMHQGLGPLKPLWDAGDLGFVHAVSTPYRDKRSHFDGQDLLEAGTVGLYDRRDGWLNRMLQTMPGLSGLTAYAIGHGEMRLMAGAAPVADWSPDAELVLSPQAQELARLIMRDDPAFDAALSEALLLSGDGSTETEPAGVKASMQSMTQAARGRSNHAEVAKFAARQLAEEARVAAFSLNGWDTHIRQAGNLKAALGRLSETILTLRTDLPDPIWDKTAILAMTEFGRTVRVNGTKGTDHGTGGAMLLAGGAVRGGRVYGQWPGLAEAELYDRRDLMPTADVRAQAAWIIRGLAGLDRNNLEENVFPGLDMGQDPGLLL